MSVKKPEIGKEKDREREGEGGEGGEGKTHTERWEL